MKTKEEKYVAMNNIIEAAANELKDLVTKEIDKYTIKGLGRTFRWTDLLDGQSKEADTDEVYQKKFKDLTGEELNPITCECID